MHEWYTRIRILCPKQKYKYIQIFDAHGTPISQEQKLDRFIDYFQILITDVQAPLPHPPSIQNLPFNEADVLH